MQLFLKFTLSLELLFSPNLPTKPHITWKSNELLYAFWFYRAAVRNSWATLLPIMHLDIIILCNSKIFLNYLDGDITGNCWVQGSWKIRTSKAESVGTRTGMGKYWSRLIPPILFRKVCITEGSYDISSFKVSWKLFFILFRPIKSL